MEKIKTMSAKSGPLKSKWAVNRSPTKALKELCIPAERWYGETSDIGKLRMSVVRVGSQTKKKQAGSNWSAHCHVKQVPNKWVFTLKTGGDGSHLRYNARLLAKGYMWRKHVDYEEM